MNAIRACHDKTILPDGAIVEMSIWRLSAADPERPHGLKHCLYCGRAGERIVGYDNERGKGDHKHIAGREMRYRFLSVEQLVQDFLADVERIRKFESQPKG